MFKATGDSMPGLGYLLKFFVFERLFLKKLFLQEADFNAYI